MICNALVCTFIESVERQLLNERDFVRQYVVVLRPKLCGLVSLSMTIGLI